MPILHKDLSRLSRDAKQLKKHLKKEHNHEMLTQQALDIIAVAFGWDNWNALYVAHEKKPDSHTWWHDMRWREKTQHIENIVHSKKEAISTVLSTKMDEQVRSSILPWLKTRLAPPLHPIEPPQKGILSFAKNKKPMPYSDIHPSRFREGLELVCSDTLVLTQHMKDHFLPAMDNPGMIVFCDTLEVTDFTRMFTTQGYTASFIGNGILPPSLEVNVRNVHFHNAPKPNGIDDYLYSIKDHIDDGWRSDKVAQLIDLVVQLRVHAQKKHRHARHYVPTAEELSEIYQHHECERIRCAAEGMIKATSHITEHVNMALEGNPHAHYIEQWQYLTMQITEHVNFINTLCPPVRLDSDITINEIKRPEKGEVIIIPAPHYGMTSKVYLSIVNDLLMASFSESPLCMASDDIFVLVNNRLRGTGPVQNEEHQLKFRAHNRAKSNIVFYGQYDHCTHSVDAQSTITSPSDWDIKDLRAR
jgi:hypothetical protein